MLDVQLCIMVLKFHTSNQHPATSNQYQGDCMDPVIYAVALVSFLAGSFGYVLVRFVLLPIGRYQRIRKRIAATLDRPVGQGHAERENAAYPPKKGEHAKKLRQLSVELSACFTDQLPHWYKLYLTKRRGEAPIEASRYLMALANTREKEHAVGQMEKISRHLRIGS